MHRPKNFSFMEYSSGMMFKSTSMSPCHLAHLKSQHKHSICITTLSKNVSKYVVHNIIFIISANI